VTAQSFAASAPLEQADLRTALHQLYTESYGDGGESWTLQQVNTQLPEIEHTTRDRIAEALEQGVRNGDSSTAIAAAIDKVKHDPARARLIAVTEINRAMNAAAISGYQDAGVQEFNVVTSVGACPVCVAVEASNPHPINDALSIPPIHPACRCSTALVPDASRG
jgi:SPP1 gp7 family putative phage head morphogenesis protein